MHSWFRRVKRPVAMTMIAMLLCTGSFTSTNVDVKASSFELTAEETLNLEGHNQENTETEDDTNVGDKTESPEDSTIGDDTNINVEVDESIRLPLVSWAGRPVGGYQTEVVYGDLNKENDQKDTNATFALSTGAIPQSKANNDYYLGSVGMMPGDAYEITFPSYGYGKHQFNFSIRSSNTGPGKYEIYYSTNGTDYIQCDGFNYSITTKTNTGTVTKDYKDVNYIIASTTLYDYTIDLPSELNHKEKIYLRVKVADDSKSANGNNIQSGGTNRFLNVRVTANPVVADDICSIVNVTPGAGAIAINQELTMVTKTEDAEIYYSINDGEFNQYDAENKPVLDTLPAKVTAYAQKEGINPGVKVTNTYTQAKVPVVKADPNGGSVLIDSKVKLTCQKQDAKIYYRLQQDADWTLYEEEIQLTELPATIQAKAVFEGYTESEISTFEYSLRENAEYNLYFGQLHSHTSYSDGAGTAEDAYKYASTEAENVDFVSVTDHSNSFDNDTQATIKDGSVSSEWVEGHKLAEQYTNDPNSENPFVALFGYEMTWSGGAPGHMNTFNTEGFLSRNMAGYGNGSVSSLPNYYAALKTVPNSISQFNHPGTSFGDFYDFGYYDEEIDNLITIVEVGNGEGAIGSSGYFPSYEYYTRALDKGWHVSPTVNQDNHKGKWGDANTGRTVILADSLTKENIYDALRNMRTYATEDNDLNIYYTLNGKEMGTIFEETPDEVNIKVKLSDATDEAIGKVEVIVNGGLAVASAIVDEKSETVEFKLSPDYSYYYIRVTQKDGDKAVTAPIWISEVEAVGISSLETTSSLQVANKPIDLTTSLFNNEKEDFVVDSIVYTVGNEVIHTSNLESNGLTVLKAGTTAKDTFSYTHDGYGATEIKVTVMGRLNGVSKQYTSTLSLTYISSSMVTKVLIDGTHNNDYVTGYYGGNVGNFADIASEAYVDVEVVTDAFTKEMLEDCALLILTAPAKKGGSFNDKSYSATVFEDDFVQLVKEYVEKGGHVILCGLADYTDTKEVQSSTEINKILEAIGATMRLNSDQMVDDVSNGGQPYRLYFDQFNYNSKYVDGVSSASQKQDYSAYSGSSVLIDKESEAAGKSEALVYGHSTTYNMNTKTFDENFVEVEKGNIVALGHETLENGSNVFLAGTVFLSNFEVKSDLDNANDSYYANRTILLNILKDVKKELPVSTIQEMRQGKEGDIFVIEGWVTAGTAQKGNKFFDTIYVQDETAGTTVFPIGDSGIEVGTKLQIVGYVDGYQGDKEIMVISYSVLDNKNLNVIAPKKVSTKDAANYELLGGSLLQVTGKVTRVVTNTAGVDYFYVLDDSGVEARVFIDGYITASDNNDTVNEDVKVGNTIKAVGLSYFNPDGPCLRVRDRAEIELVTEEQPEQTPEQKPEQTPEQNPGQIPEQTPDSKPEQKPEEKPEETPTPGFTQIGKNNYTVDGSKNAWNSLQDALASTKKENTIKIALSKTDAVPKAIVETVAKKNLTLRVTLNSDFTVIIDGSKLKAADAKKLDFAMNLDSQNVSNKTVSSLMNLSGASVKDTMQISAAAKNTYTNAVTMRFDVSKLVKQKAATKKVAGLYHYNESTKTLVLKQVSKISTSNKADFAITKGGNYVIAVSDKLPIDKNTLSKIKWGNQTSDVVKTTTLDLKKAKTASYKMSVPSTLQSAIDAKLTKMTVTYTSSEPSVVKVNASGKMTAVKKGKAEVKATVKIGTQKVTFKKKVVVK